jgi:hypothetical protein
MVADPNTSHCKENDATVIQPDRCKFHGLGPYSISARLLCLHQVLQSIALLVDVEAVEKSCKGKRCNFHSTRQMRMCRTRNLLHHNETVVVASRASEHSIACGC